MTLYHKRVFPIFWFGFLGLVSAGSFYLKVSKNNGVPIGAVIIPIVMVIFGFFLFKKLSFDLVDEVYDCGSFLLIKNSSKEERIPFSNIKNLSCSMMVNPPRITLSLHIACSFGEEVAFSPPVRFGFKPLQKNPLVQDLIDRIDKSRRS